MNNDDFETQNHWQILFPEISQNVNISPPNNLNNNDQQENTQGSDDSSGSSDHNQEANNHGHDDQHNNEESSVSSDSQGHDDQHNNESSASSDKDQEKIRQIITDEELHKHKKEFSISSDISDDLILLDQKLINDEASISSVDKLLENEEEIECASETDVLSRPSIQVMQKEDREYDPRRIPSSVFERSDSHIPAEWSGISNESLFSIHVGTASIGRDEDLQLSAELKKHGGLLWPKSIRREGFLKEDLQEIRELAGLPRLSDEQVVGIIGAKVVKDGGFDHKEKQLGQKIEEREEVMKVSLPIKLEENQQNKQLSSISLHSNTSEDSTYSFKFPTFGNGVVKGSSPKKISNQPVHETFPVVHSDPIRATPSSEGFFSCFQIFCCNSCCHCPCFSSCSSCTHCPSYFSCTSCTSCFSCKACKKCFNCC